MGSIEKRRRRSEKRKLRLDITKVLDGECALCECNTTGYERMQVCITTCPVGAKLKKLSQSLLSVDVANNSPSLPLQKGRWTDDEILYLVNHKDRYSISHLAERLDRSPDSVYQKLTHLNKKQRIEGDLHAV